MSYCTMVKIGELGRMGNMLFQISMVYGYARKHDMEPIIPPFKYADSFAGPFNQVVLAKQPQKYLEPHFHYAEVPNMEYVDLEGYWQSARYFEHCEEEILKMFTFKPEIIEKTKNFLNTNRSGKIPVGIHMRFTDYLTMNHYYHNFDTDWYRRAMNLFDPTTHQFFIVSDDVHRAQLTLPIEFSDTVFSGFDEVMDMCILSQCTHNIICNSSFSWWGSYLNRNPDKRIIAPKNWFHDVAGHNTKDLYLPNWELL